VTDYVHGYSAREAERLGDQARTLEELLHFDTGFPAGARVLEAGCGVGAQTVTLVRTSPGAEITSIDISAESLRAARERVGDAGTVRFLRADLFDLPFADGAFDHIFLCFVLEHLREPGRALVALRRVLRAGGTITVIEGDHGSCYFHPETEATLHAWRGLVLAQARLGGNSLIGRRLYPLLRGAGFAVPGGVSPRMVYVDASRPALVDGFVRKTIAAMVAGARENALRFGVANGETFDAGVRDFLALADSPEGTFCYTFFKAVGVPEC
jgi:protein-L-isoaspartate O-methyltransferase